MGNLPTDPVAVDAIPDIGENQQIVFTQWPGRSPQDIEDQISYPLTTYLLGIPGVKSIRSSSIFGFSSIYIIFEDQIEFYWSRSRILEKLNSIPGGLLPPEVKPSLGPDATALGQVFWYTLEGRDLEGNPTGGWDLHEIRSVQDFYVKYGLNAASGVSEVASIGGFVQEYQIDVNPDALQAYQIPLHQLMQAVRKSNRDVGAKTIEVNQAEYLVRGLGYIKFIEELEQAVVTVEDNVPIRVKDLGVVTLGPAARRGLLDKDGAEVVGGVVVARHGANPLEVIDNVKSKIEVLAPGLPKKILPNGKESQLTIVPFYDRSQLIYETLGTLEEALSLEILISILVVIVMVYNLRASILVASLLPIAILMVFIAMRYLGIDANIVALSGIAIAIGTMIDLGIILSENIIKHLEESPEQDLLTSIYQGSKEVASAILTAVSTTILSFIPVFTLQAAEGKLFGPLAFTKTFALIATLLVTLLVLPTLAYWIFGLNIKASKFHKVLYPLLIITGIVALILGHIWGGTMLALYGVVLIVKDRLGNRDLSEVWYDKLINHAELVLALIAVAWLLGRYWLPLGAAKSLLANTLFVSLLLALILGSFLLLARYYQNILNWCLANKVKFLLVPVLLMALAFNIWVGFDKVFGFITQGFDRVGVDLKTTSWWSGLSHAFPGTGEEFMPALDEGSFLLMPTSMPHSGIGHNRKVLGQLDMLLSGIPEVELAVGKLGRVESALDPAPISMYENVINYKPEYMVGDSGRKIRFKVDDKNQFILWDGTALSQDEALTRGVTQSQLVPHKNGRFYRNWRPDIKSPDDIWNEVVQVTNIPGVTSAPRLQPIETRLVMLQTGMRAPMGVKVFGPDLETIQNFTLQLESLLKQVPGVKAPAVFADRIVGKPYLHLNIKREEIARYGLNVEDVQQTIETAIGGMNITTTVEARERYPVRVRYPRELRDNPESLSKILISTPTGAQIPMGQIVEFEYVQGPQAIKSEDTFLVGYVLFDKLDGYAEVDVVEAAESLIASSIAAGSLAVPSGINYRFSGSYENQLRAQKRLAVVVPVVLILIFLILYLQFKSSSTTLMVFTGVALAFSGGFIMIWLYSQSWFLNFSLLGVDLQNLFQIKPINLSVAVWVGFIALFGIATDDGVLMGTYLDQRFKQDNPKTLDDIRKSVIAAGSRRIRPAIMTSATTLIALLPIISSTGRGSDIMVPMAIPAFGGMAIAAITYFVVPVLYSLREERKLKGGSK